MRSALAQAILPIGALAAALKPSAEAITARSKTGLTPGQRLPGYVTTSNWTSEDLVGIDLDAYPEIFRPAYDSDPEATKHALGTRDVDPGQLQARDDVTTDARISSNRIDWGCDGEIQAPIEAAVAALCNNGACVEGNEYLHPVKWTNGASLMDYNLVFKARGWYNGVVRHYLIEGLQSTLTEDTWSVRDVYWQYGGVGGTYGGGVCHMTEFTSNLQIHRHIGEGAPHDRIILEVELRASPEVCLADAVMRVIEDNLRAVGPGFFGSPTAIPEC